MNVLIVCQYFYPEEFKVNDVAEELVKKGYNVTVITGKPNYPTGKLFDGYKCLGIQFENYKGARVIRLPLITRGNGGGIRLALNYVSFLLTGSFYVLTHKMDFDKILCFQLSPISMAYPAIIAKKKSKACLSLWVQDLWPESVFAAGQVKRGLAGLANTVLTKMVRSIYKACDTIFIQSPRFSESILAKGNFKDKLVFAPNWAEDVFCQMEVKENNVELKLPNGFNVMFAGNIGEAQDFDNIINAANLLKGYIDIHWVVVGDGRKRVEAEQRVRELCLENNVHFLGRHPVKMMPSYFKYADAMLVTLRDEFIFSLTIPSKVQAYMASGKPILTMLTGVGNEIIEEANCGFIADSGDFRTLAKNVLRMYQLSPSERKLLGKNATDYYDAHFRKLSVIETLIGKW